MLRSMILLLCSVTSLIGNAADIAPCTEPDYRFSGWDCFGSLRLEVSALGQHYVANFSKLSPDESKSEVVINGFSYGESIQVKRLKQYLEFHSAIFPGNRESGVMWLFVLLTTSVKNPPGDFPLGITPISYRDTGELDSVSAVGTVERISDTDYRVKLRVNLALEKAAAIDTDMEMFWSRVYAPTLPDATPMGGWFYNCNREEVLNEEHHVVPEDVTLGDIRRGWDQACEWNRDSIP